jgi:hypothetical protein
MLPPLKCLHIRSFLYYCNDNSDKIYICFTGVSQCMGAMGSNLHISLFNYF